MHLGLSSNHSTMRSRSWFAGVLIGFAEQHGRVNCQVPVWVAVIEAVAMAC